MRTIILFFGLSISVNLFSQSAITGIWEGKLDLQSVKMRVVLNIQQLADGKLSATMDSPDQGVKGIPCDKTVLKEDSIFITINKIKMNYAGNLNESKTMLTGIFTQGSNSLPLNMQKVEKITELKRPQTPAPPFKYTSYELEYDNADKTVHFGATLTVPKIDSNIRFIKAPVFPAVILITGSGQQDRDETIMGHKPFAVIADYLSSRGIAVLRVDDRGMGKTTGDVLNVTSADFAKDVEAGLNFLKRRPEIDTNKIGLIGHSEGGLIAPMVASKRRDISFIILLAGPGVDGASILYKQQMDALINAGMSKQALTAYDELTKKKLAILKKATNAKTANELLLQLFKQWQPKQKDSILIQLNAKKLTPQQYAAATVANEFNPWLNYFYKTDPAIYLSKIKCRVLALNGDKDIQVYAKQNIPAITAALNKGGNKKYKAVVLPGLNHLFQHCTKCTVQEYGELEETFSPEVLKLMYDWIINDSK
jgi:uncharacterized protein